MGIAVFATPIWFRLCVFVPIYAPGFSLPIFRIFNESQGIIIGCQWLVDNVLSADRAGCVVSNFISCTKIDKQERLCY